MATTFKKSKRNFRKKVVDEDDETGHDDESENVPAISKNADENSRPKEKKKSKTKVDKVASSNSLLSFDDEDEGEVFKVRKSKESRRLAKKIEQERKKKEKIGGEADANKNDESLVQGQDVDTDEKLAALRAELSQITREDDDDEVDDDTESIGSGSVKEPATNSNIRTDFSIPDAATIHAARKRREMARQTEQDYIPLDDTKKYEGQFASKGRLVREDENDVSDDEGEEGPITFSVARKTGFPALDRRREVEAALANQELEEKSDNEEAEDDEELKLWEDEQIRKGVKGASAPLVQTELPETTEMTNSLYQQQYAEGHPSVFQIGQQPYTYGAGFTEVHTNGNQTYGLTVASNNSLQSQHSVTVDMICDKMKQQLATLQEVHRGHQMDKEKATSQLETAQGSIKKLERQGRNAEQRFTFFQEMRGYVRDLLECLNHKVGDTSMI